MDSIKEWVFQISLPNLEFRLAMFWLYVSYLSGFKNALLLLLRLPVGRGGVINSPRFCFFFFFPVSKVGAPLMGDTAVHSLSHDFKLNF